MTPETENSGVLSIKEEGGSDYVLNADANSVWIEIGSLSVYIKRDDEGVSVDIYPTGDEMNNAIVSTWAEYSEGIVDEP